ncbi:hypothetical protein CB1_000273065 [Camelus ferus]|nr:hypothetical protein CB1_000273065 [Camelus ferus]
MSRFAPSLGRTCTHVILDSADVLSQYQLSSIRKNRIHIANPDFVWDSIKDRRLVDVGNYGPRKSLDITPTPRQRASSAGPQQGTERAVVELRCSQDPGAHTFLIAAHFLQADSAKLLLEEVINSGVPSQEVSALVEMVWAEALGRLEHTLCTPVNRMSLKDVSKAEGTLLLVKAALKNGETEERLQTMMTEFYRLIPHRDGVAGRVTLSLLAKKEDLCQTTLSRGRTFCSRDSSSGTAEADPAGQHPVDSPWPRVWKLTVSRFSSDSYSKSPVNILQIFRVGRASETTEFLSQLGNVKALLHGSPVRSFVGILSRTSTKYARLGQTDGTRLLVVCDVALGRCADLREKDFSLTEAPPGYDSVHGLPGTAAVPTDFEDDEFVVYKTNQVKMKYIVKFCIPGDEVKDFHPCGNTELEEYRPELPKFSRLEDHQLPDSKPLPDVQAGLQDPAGNVVPLEDVHIKGKIIDFVAQVVVFQTYTNHSHVPIEAKYVFPLDDKAAVCGFEAFIGGRHVVGEIRGCRVRNGLVIKRVSSEEPGPASLHSGSLPDDLASAPTAQSAAGSARRVLCRCTSEAGEARWKAGESLMRFCRS